jgi:hypothetical protein
MSKDSIQQFSTAAAANTDIGGINVNTGWPPNNVGPAFRELMAFLADQCQGVEPWNSVKIASSAGTLGSWLLQPDLSSPSKLAFQQYNNGGTLVGTPLTLDGNVVTIAGSVSFTSFSTSGNVSVGGTLGVTGATTLSSLAVSGGATVGGSAVVKADSGTYSISISGNAATATSATSATTAGTATTASAVAWSGVTSKPSAITSYAVNMDQNVATSSTPTFSGLTVGGAGIGVVGSTSGTAGGWQLEPSGTASFSGGVNIAVNASGLDMLAQRFIAASDGRLKSERREITAAEAMRFLWQVPPTLYLKDGAGGTKSWEAGFIAQDMLTADLPQTLIVSIDPGMPEERYGISGPVGRRYEMQMGATVAYLAAAVRHLAAEVERLKAAA